MKDHIREYELSTIKCQVMLLSSAVMGYGLGLEMNITIGKTHEEACADILRERDELVQRCNQHISSYGESPDITSIIESCNSIDIKPPTKFYYLRGTTLRSPIFHPPN